MIDNIKFHYDEINRLSYDIIIEEHKLRKEFYNHIINKGVKEIILKDKEGKYGFECHFNDYGTSYHVVNLYVNEDNIIYMVHNNSHTQKINIDDVPMELIHYMLVNDLL